VFAFERSQGEHRVARACRMSDVHDRSQSLAAGRTRGEGVHNHVHAMGRHVWPSISFPKPLCEYKLSLERFADVTPNALSEMEEHKLLCPRVPQQQLCHVTERDRRLSWNISWEARLGINFGPSFHPWTGGRDRINVGIVHDLQRG
jgi:hypothetical protein